MPEPVHIQPYNAGNQRPVVGLHPYDPRAPEVARAVAGLINRVLPGVVVEHVGSTSVPGCAGKGIVDLMVLTDPTQLEAVTQAVDTLGFQPQSGGVIHGKDRPMREGSVSFDGAMHRLHVHIIPDGAPPVALFRTFRDRLRADTALLAEYVAHKERIVSGGAGTREEYSRAKAGFIQSVLQGGNTGT